MFLFLDVVNPIPEFFIFDDNKLILSKKIIYNDSAKLSDHIFQSYIEINTQLNLNKYITKVGITIGPGSFTSLRVGAALISGIYISKNLPFCTISAHDIINFKSDKKLLQNSGVFMHSANDQKFFCNLNKDKIIEYSKIEDKEFSLPKNIDLIYYNHKKMDLQNTNCNQIKFSFEDEVLKNLEKIKFITNNIIKPIYISNNSILN